MAEKRASAAYTIPQGTLQSIKNKMLNWIRPFSIFAYLDNNGYCHKPCRFELLAAAAPLSLCSDIDAGEGDWLFGHLAYDYKNKVEPRLQSRHPFLSGFKEQLFFRPAIVVSVASGSDRLEVSTVGLSADQVLQEILDTADIDGEHHPRQVSWQPVFTQAEYLECIEAIRSHIEEGDCYELNFCTGASALVPGLDPAAAFHRLNRLNPSPFAALYRNDDAWLMCASPERFLFREKDWVVSQPIKGTARRHADPATDAKLKQALYLDAKERAENVMIVDLVRNDLARSCIAGSVEVPELFGLYSFPQVHQLISTVSGRLMPGISNGKVIRNAFPMGSMTGAPKVKVMELTERYERLRRELYSGAVGYVMPSGDFDFNVVIRSLLYNGATARLAYQTGGAITYASDPLAEWEEVRLKARAMEQIFL